MSRDESRRVVVGVIRRKEGTESFLFVVVDAGIAESLPQSNEKRERKIKLKEIGKIHRSERFDTPCGYVPLSTFLLSLAKIIIK